MQDRSLCAEILRSLCVAGVFAAKRYSELMIGFANRISLHCARMPQLSENIDSHLIAKLFDLFTGIESTEEILQSMAS